MSRPSVASNKRLRPIPSDYEKTISNVTHLARKRSISLLDKCLNNHHLNAAEQRDLIIDVSKSFGLSIASHEVCADEISDNDQNPLLGKQRSSTRIGTSVSKETGACKKEDDHNEVCEVCEKGGDLLCCDTCSLVFHLGCIRPKIASIPKGKWSCAYCISDGVSTGDVMGAKKALTMMGRLSRGLESEDEAEDSSIVTKSCRIGEVMIIRSGKRFIVRKVAHSQIAELGRYDNLDDALGSIKPVYKKVLAVGSNTSDGDAVAMTIPIGAIEDDDLWCTHCMDDPAVAVCAFCGCRTCFGKHNSEYLLLCDYCDQESHTYCLTPKLTEIPEEAWYCGSCVDLGLVKVEPVESLPVVEAKVDEDDSHQIVVPVYIPEIPAHPLHRIKGRPGRPKKVQTNLAEDYVPPVRALKVAGRGRGRPPGSGRILGLGEDGVTIKIPTKMSIHGPMRVKSEARMTPKMTSKDDISCSQGYYPHTAFGSNLIAGAGVKAILAILESNAGKRPFWPAEKQVMSQMREWSPLEDLQIVHAALNLQKDIILSRIRGLDPSFVEPISAAKSIRNAILRASKELSSADSGGSAAEKPAPCLNRSLYTADDAVIPDHMNLVTIENAVVDVEDDSLLLEGDLIEELNLDVDLMAVDMEDGFVDSGDELGAAGDDGEEGEGEDEEEELSKGDIEQGDEESKSDDEEEEEEDSLGGEEADRNELEDDDGGEEGSKEDLEGDDGEDEEEASCSIDFLESGMRLQDGEDDESAGEEDYNGKEELIEGASSPFSEGGASLDTNN